jgi:penicillin-binding protein 1A
MATRRLVLPLIAGLAVLLAGALVAAFAVVVAYPNLPSLEVLTDYRPKVPLRIFSADKQLIGEFGEERRAIVRIAEVPPLLKQAILAAEDERFYQHGGVDYMGVLRAALSNFRGSKQGASTITMQVARNFFLSREQTYTRKFNEMLLAFKIEHSLSKDQILELYINQIFLGQRAYGFAAAAQIYFGKPLGKLNLAETAMLAGLPKGPSRFNPVVNPKRAKLRQQYVLRRMHELGYIRDDDWRAADREVLTVKRELQDFPVRADHFSEMVRQAVYERYQDDTYNRGFVVHTTLDANQQAAAYQAVRRGVLAYDRRHGYRGPEEYVELPAGANEEALEDALQDAADSDDLLPALVLEAGPASVKVYRKGGETLTVSGEGVRFAQRSLSDKAAANQRIRRGAIIRLQKDDKGAWQITQLPSVEAGFVAVDPKDGAIRALVGGFDFLRNKFNHVTQALRQPGSSFKPFIYSAALEKGFTAATMVNDAPIRFEASQTGSEAWEPKNFDGKFEGQMRLRTALAKSKNVVSVRILQAIGAQYVQDYISRFGFDPKLHPPYLTMALGAGNVTPMQMAAAYAVFANDGFRIAPYAITQIVDPKGQVLSEAKPKRAGEDAERVIDARNAFVMRSLLGEVVRSGTAGRAMQLGRGDLAGKTGTTNDFVDAWFAGFGTGVVAIAWIGFDNPHSLGNNETGGNAALPMWIQFMGRALKGVPEAPVTVPEGIMTVRINPDTGMRDPDGKLSEYVYQEFMPPEQDGASSPFAPGAKPPDEIRNQLF